jgi:hypothetical protein
MIRRSVWAAPAIAFLFAPSTFADDPPAECRYNSRANTCMPYGCLPDPALGQDLDPDLNRDKPGFCGLCRPGHDEDCAGARCNANGTCSVYPDAPPPPPVWPHFHLLVGDASLSIEESEVRPLLGVGYVFQGAFVSVKPVKELDGGPYIAQNLPWLYWNVGATGAFAAESQNVFIEAGLTGYYPGFPLAITTLTAEALYQREGATIWQLGDTSENDDRLGPALVVGFLQNLFLRGAWLFPIRGDQGKSQVVVSILYMRDLAGDLIPNRFHKYLPEAFR